MLISTVFNRCNVNKCRTIGIAASGTYSYSAEAVTEDKVIQLKSQLSDEIDADLATVISDLSARQTALEASMRIIGQTAQLTVLNFL